MHMRDLLSLLNEEETNKPAPKLSDEKKKQLEDLKKALATAKAKETSKADGFDAKAVAQEIKDAWGTFNDDEEGIYDALRKVKNLDQWQRLVREYPDLVVKLKSDLDDNELQNVVDILKQSNVDMDVEVPAEWEEKEKAEEPKAEEPKAEEPKAEEPKAVTSSKTDVKDIKEITKVAYKGLTDSIRNGENSICNLFSKSVDLGNKSLLEKIVTEQLAARAEEAQNVLYKEMQDALLDWVNKEYYSSDPQKLPTSQNELASFLNNIKSK